MLLSVIKHSEDLVDVLYAAMLTLNVVQSRHLTLEGGLLILHLAQGQLPQLFLAVKFE